ncbi:MAG: SUMF1/EgtB/PvdO family nonheme iron enzyme [Candidatus Contendobacter sp.]|nr:SUMF1/EgtB/PvdO family nonheme iron enzyme [Candidatus Contendobacter sp.]
MDLTELAGKLAALLAVYEPAIATPEYQQEGESSLVQDVWQRLQPSLEAKAGAREALNDCWEQPDDPDLQTALRVQLKKILADVDLATDLDRLLKASAEPANFRAEVHGAGAIAQGSGAVAAGEKGIAVGGNAGNVSAVDQSTTVNAPGATFYIGEAPARMTAVDRHTALGRYLQHLIGRNRYLQLQGIRAGGKLVQIELDRIYIRLRTTQQRLVGAEERWLHEERALAPGERGRLASPPAVATETVTVTVEAALAQHLRLVVLGDPGSGKTTLLRYLALNYARDLAENGQRIQDSLGQAEPRRLPILLQMRQIGRFLQTKPDDGTEGCARLLEFLLGTLKNERIALPDVFFDPWLTDGDAVILLDGLDEVADPELRRRVARLVEDFTRAYARCRFVVTSRIVGYTGAARLGESYAATTVQDFSRDDIAQFLAHWHRLIAVGQMGEGDSALAYATEQTRQLLDAIDHNPRIRDLAINPLMLTVIALVHRDRVKLPDRRAELYAEAVDVLLGKWDEARGVQETAILPDGRPFDTGDKRLLLQDVALALHEQKRKDIAVADLRAMLRAHFADWLLDPRTAEQAVNRFLAVIEERTGLLLARDEGLYSFSHLTFQEYLAALGIAARNDAVAYTLNRIHDPWWREVILLEAGYLSTQSKEKTSGLVRAIADHAKEPEPYHNLVLAAECLRDVGGSRVQGNLAQDIPRRLRQHLETPPPFLARWFKKLGAKSWIEQRAKAMDALVRAGSGFWTPPYGEPEWVEIPAGGFWMGSGGDLHQVRLDTYRIARVPITNAQYHLFIQATGHPAPEHWREDRPPKGLESHPVVNVSWHDAMAYCRWLSERTGKPITLPSEAEWEKAARGDKDQREYPWGDTFEATRCNSIELGLGDTTPVGIFPEGASPSGCLDMVGNVWEWTRSLYADYPYPPEGLKRQAREDPAAPGRRVLRGGAFRGGPRDARCADRFHFAPVSRNDGLGFRVVVSPLVFSDR